MMWNLDGTLKRLSIFPHPREVVAASADMATGVGEGREEGKPGADNRRAGMSEHWIIHCIPKRKRKHLDI